MKEQIKRQTPWLLVLSVPIMLAIVVLLIDSMGYHWPEWVRRYWAALTIRPSLLLSQHDFMASIWIFNSDAAEVDVWKDYILPVYVALSVILVAGPFLFAMGYRRFESEGEPPARNILWYAGAVLVLGSLLSAYLTGLMAIYDHQQSRGVVADNRAYDQFRQQTLDVALEAAERMLLPQELGGGDGSFRSFPGTDGSVRNVVPDDFLTESQQRYYSYVIDGPVQDSVLTFTMVGRDEGINPDYRNADGQTGRIQVSATVNPFAEQVVRLREDNRNIFD